MRRKMKVRELIEILKQFPEDAPLSAYYSLFVGNNKIELTVPISDPKG